MQHCNAICNSYNAKIQTLIVDKNLPVFKNKSYNIALHVVIWVKKMNKKLKRIHDYF